MSDLPNGKPPGQNNITAASPPVRRELDPSAGLDGQEEGTLEQVEKEGQEAIEAQEKESEEAVKEATKEQEEYVKQEDDETDAPPVKLTPKPQPRK